MTNPTANVTLHNSKQAKSIFWHGFLIWLMATIFYFYDNFLNVSAGAMKSELAAVFAKSASDLGILSSCYLWAYGLLQIPAGMLMDKFGPRRVLTFAGICCALGALFFGMANTIMLAIMGRLFIGCGAAFAIIGCTKIASVWFNPRRFAFFVGLMVSIGYTGGALGTAKIGWLIDMVGHWRQTMFWVAAVGGGVVLLLWLVVRDKPPVPAFACEEKTKKQKQASLFKGLVEVSACGQAWIVILYAGLMFLPIMVLGGLWGAPFLEVNGFARADAGKLVGLIFIGFAFGGPVFGWLSDHVGRRKWPMMFANIVALTLVTFIIYNPSASGGVMGTLLFLLGFFSSGFIIAFAVMREKNRTEITGTSIGVINTFNSLIPAFFQLIIGVVLDYVGKDGMIKAGSEKVFTLEHYQSALMLIPICLVVAFITIQFLKETYCKSKEELEVISKK